MVCENLAEAGQCENNSTVLRNCRWSCGNCRDLFEVSVPSFILKIPVRTIFFTD